VTITAVGVPRRPRPLRERPRVAVVVPCFNYASFLGDCLTSALQQADVDVDVIVVDDASTDGSGELADAFATVDPRVRVLHHQRNRGHIATYNDGLQEVKGEFVVLLSADDLLPPGALSRAVALMRAHPSVGLVYGHPVNFSGEPPVAGEQVRSWSVWSGHAWVRKCCRTARNPIYSPEVVMRTSVMRAIGPFDASLPHSGDLEMWLRAAAISDIGRVNGPDQGLRRIHGTNMSETTFAGVLVDLEERGRAYDAFLAGAGSSLRGADRLKDRVRRNLARCVLEHACTEVAAGRAEASVVEASRALAAAWVPDPTTLLAWRELRLRLEQPDRRTARWECALHAALRDLRWRIAWRRWRRSGV
jgi:hypothetical protein